jgi:hypothetical protein
MFLPPGQMEMRYSKYAFILDNTRNLMNRCPQGRVNLNIDTFTGTREGDRQLLEKLSLKGMIYRYGKNNK